jgi:transposase
VDTETGEFQEKRLAPREEAEKFYRALAGKKVRVGMEASGHARWFEGLLAELQFELWIGDAAEIQSKRVRKQKTDRQDAQLILRLMLKDDFPRFPSLPLGEARSCLVRLPSPGSSGRPSLARPRSHNCDCRP